MSLGQKIKSRRLQLKLTQSAICGEQITRNMLSSIENDKATPSLDTLMYISRRLSVPASYLVSDDEDLFFYEKKDSILGIRQAFAEEKYSACISRISKLSRVDDELATMLASCHFALGKRSVLSGSLHTAKKHLELAEQYCSKTVYDTSAVQKLLPLYIALAENIQAPLLEFNARDFEHKIDPELDYELFKYVTGDLTYSYNNPLYANHSRAKELIKLKRYEEALAILEQIIEQRNHETYNAYVIFGVYADMEYCSKQLANFENAYKYAAKRLSMLEGFKT